MPRWSQAAAFAAFLLVPERATAQAAATVEPVLEQLAHLTPLNRSSAPVHGMTLDRGAGRFEMTDGRLWLLSDVNGGTMGAVYVGSGVFHFAASLPIERGRLRSFFASDSLAEGVRAFVFLFTDSTLSELRAHLTFDSTAAPSEAKDAVKEMQDYSAVVDKNFWPPALLSAALNGGNNGYFLAHVRRASGDPLRFVIDPLSPEPVTLSTKGRWEGAGKDFENVTSFALDGGPARPGVRRAQVEISAYRMHVDMPATFDGGVRFSATADCDLRDDGHHGPWVPFYLYSELIVDSAQWVGAGQALTYRTDKSGVLWVFLPRQVTTDKPLTLHLAYHGEMLDRIGNWFFQRTSGSWYPRPLDMMSKATFDITYRTPYGFRLASIGTRTDSTLDGRTVVTRWTYPEPMRNASFNLGLFDVYQDTIPGAPPVTLLWSESGHRLLARGGMLGSQHDMKGHVAGDVENAMKFYTLVYGPPMMDRFYATEIPGFHGEAFPGLVHLSWVTFHETDNKGEMQVFRAHETAHQWWAIGVDYATYRDQWLSEGMATFSGMWFLQTAQRDNEDYLNLLRTHGKEILDRREDAQPIGLGSRVATGRHPADYDLLVYWKGAWTMHMLRTLLVQLSTMNEDRFTSAMQEFYTTHRGGAVTTQDLREVMERHSGADLGWFFDEWVDGAAIPTYTWASQVTPTGDGHWRVQLRVKQTQVPDSFQMYVPVTVELKDGRMLRTRIHVAGPLTTTELPLLPAGVKSVKFNDLEGVLADVKTEGW